MSDTPRTNVIDRITEYLSSGGLFNPEMANHDEVRNLLIDCRQELSDAEDAYVALRRAFGERK